MAELGLAIAGVAATGAALSKSLFQLYHSARGSFKDAKETAQHLELLKAVLRELKSTLRRTDGICSEDAEQIIHGLLARCGDLFDQIEQLTSPYLASDGQVALKSKLMWHFRKDQVRLVNAQLESIRSTLHLMVSIVALGHQLAQEPAAHVIEDAPSFRLHHRLRFASELIGQEQSSLANLCLVEEQIVVNQASIEEHGEQLPRLPPNVNAPNYASISKWLVGVVGISDQASSNSQKQSGSSTRSAATLSAAQRVIAGSRSEDVEILLEKWTALSEHKSQCSRPGSEINYVVDDGLADSGSSSDSDDEDGTIVKNENIHALVDLPGAVEQEKGGIILKDKSNTTPEDPALLSTKPATEVSFPTLNNPDLNVIATESISATQIESTNNLSTVRLEGKIESDPLGVSRDIQQGTEADTVQHPLTSSQNFNQATVESDDDSVLFSGPLEATAKVNDSPRSERETLRSYISPRHNLDYEIKSPVPLVVDYVPRHTREFRRPRARPTRSTVDSDDEFVIRASRSRARPTRSTVDSDDESVIRASSSRETIREVIEETFGDATQIGQRIDSAIRGQRTKNAATRMRTVNRKAQSCVKSVKPDLVSDSDSSGVSINCFSKYRTIRVDLRKSNLNSQQSEGTSNLGSETTDIHDDAHDPALKPSPKSRTSSSLKLPSKTFHYERRREATPSNSDQSKSTRKLKTVSFVSDADAVMESSRSRVQDWLLGVTKQCATDESTQTPTSSQSPILLDNDDESLPSQAPSLTTESSISGESISVEDCQLLLEAGNRLFRLKRFSEASTLYHDAYSQLKRQSTPSELHIMQVQQKLGALYGELDESERAIETLYPAFRKQTVLLGSQDPNTLVTAHYLARMLYQQEKWDESCMFYEMVWEIRKVGLESQESTPSDVTFALRLGHEYGRALMECKRISEAIAVYDAVYPAAKQHEGLEESEFTMHAAFQLGRALRHENQTQRAKQVFSESLDLCKCAPESISPKYLNDLQNEMALCEFAEGNFGEAAQLSREVLAFRAPPELSSSTYMNLQAAETAECLANSLHALGKDSEAQQHYQDAIGAYRKSYGASHPHTQKLSLKLSELLVKDNKPDEAEKVLASSFKGFKAEKDHVQEEGLAIAQNLGPLILRNANQEKNAILKSHRKAKAIPVFKAMYIGQCQHFGSNSPEALHTGHAYGSLCLELKDYGDAEWALKEVWSERRKAFGQDDPQTMESGFQLGQVFLYTNKISQAITTLEPIYKANSRINGMQSLQTIECAEMFAMALISGEPDIRRRRQAHMLLYEMLAVRKELYGPVVSTITASWRVAIVCVTQNRMQETETLLRWIYEAPIPKSRKLGMILRVNKISAGLLASGLAYTRGDNSTGNAMICRMNSDLAQKTGWDHSVVQSLRYCYAGILFLQGDSKGYRSIWREIFKSRKRKLGRKHRDTILAGNTLAIGLLLDALLRDRPFSRELDKVNDWLYRRLGPEEKVGTASGTLPMKLSLLCAYELQKLGYEELPKYSLEWLLQAQKRLCGRTAKVTLETIALAQKFSAIRLKNRSTRTASKDWTKQDPRVFIPKIWPTIFQTARNVYERKIVNRSSSFFTKHLPQLLAKYPVWRNFSKDLISAEVYATFTSLNFNNAILQTATVEAKRKTTALLDADLRCQTISTASSDSDSNSDVEELHDFSRLKTSLIDVAEELARDPSLTGDYSDSSIGSRSRSFSPRPTRFRSRSPDSTATQRIVRSRKRTFSPSPARHPTRRPPRTTVGQRERTRSRSDSPHPSTSRSQSSESSKYRRRRRSRSRSPEPASRKLDRKVTGKLAAKPVTKSTTKDNNSNKFHVVLFQLLEHKNPEEHAQELGNSIFSMITPDSTEMKHTEAMLDDAQTRILEEAEWEEEEDDDDDDDDDDEGFEKVKLAELEGVTVT